MKNVFVLVVGLTLAAVLGWMARGWYQLAYVIPTEGPGVRPASQLADRRAAAADAALLSEPAEPSPPIESTEPLVAADLLAPIATVTATVAPSEVAKEVVVLIRDADAPRPMIVPVAGVDRAALRDMFNETRGDHRHEAIDIMAPRGTPVLAADDGVVKKLFTSKGGGLTVYEFDPDERFCYYYAHLDRYAAGLHEGQRLRRGEILGYVGSTGNASKDAPHLHFALIRLDPDKRWWKGTYVNPFPLFTLPQAR